MMVSKKESFPRADFQVTHVKVWRGGRCCLGSRQWRLSTKAIAVEAVNIFCKCLAYLGGENTILSHLSVEFG